MRRMKIVCALVEFRDIFLSSLSGSFMGRHAGQGEVPTIHQGPTHPPPPWPLSHLPALLLSRAASQAVRSTWSMGARVLAAAISKGHIGLFLTFRPTFRPRQLDILTFRPTFRPRQLDPPKRSQGDRNRHFLRCPG